MSKTAEKISMNQQEAARSLGVSDRTLRNWNKIGLLKPIRRGGVALYSVDVLKNFVKPTVEQK